MKISTKGRYAVRLMIDIATHNQDGHVSIKDIAVRQNVSTKYLEQIVNILNRVGYLKSFRGARGGYALAKSPKDYTIGEILRATEGSLAPVSCLDDVPNKCERVKSCPTIKFWEGLYKIVNDYVDSVTLADIIENCKDGSDSCEYYI